MVRWQAVTRSDGNWHESVRSEGLPAEPSDLSLGFLFFRVAGTVALFGTLLLRPLNRVWRRISRQLFGTVNSIMMGVLFFIVLTLIAVIMRWAGRDPLRLRFEPERSSYWVARARGGERQVSMQDQF